MTCDVCHGEGCIDDDECDNCLGEGEICDCCLEPPSYCACDDDHLDDDDED